MDGLLYKAIFYCKKTYMEKIAVVGLGYVGLPLALLAERKGLSVIGIDIDEKKISLLNSKVSRS